ncbi:spore cortex peptidoglycan biosynthesis regulator SpoVE [Marininema mesophilum]|uniref:Spore cortex peptidoglycan biosynthesis regulator SpoVE n=1 Tax=Marininema mesophilum TaxID=1048340 RepID=A0A1H2QEA8_9BACL|nr:stage V sporulation protein E [Marininema mesophilum]SDW05462.1 spore cortex peptidoglycan biosynthesis regulator SpoVE [Marininema mesophilum]
MPNPHSRRSPDLIIIVVILMLLTLGVIMVYSASAAYSQHKFGDSFFYAKRQLLFAGVGVLLMFVVSRLDPKLFRQWAKPALIICFALLALVLVPGVGILRNGARSWLGIGAFSIQPSEFTKLGVILFLARYFSNRSGEIQTLQYGMMYPLGIAGSAFALIMMQPDLGTGTVMMGTAIILIYIAGVRINYLVALMGIGLAGFAGLVLAAPYRIKRITAFLNPWQDPLNAGYQIIQSLFAIGPGGLMGLGLGMSRQKHLYLPEPHTDFIFSILAEELGFIGAGTAIILFAILIWRGIRVAITIQDMFLSLVAAGVTGMIVIQAVINIGVVSGAFPVTGITLPFLSYGGSSLTLTLVAVGILLNLSRYTDQ